MSYNDHMFFSLSFSAIIVVVPLVARTQIFLVSDQFHFSLLTQVPCNCMLVRIVARMAFSQSIDRVTVSRTKIGFLLLSSIPECVIIRIVLLF